MAMTRTIDDPAPGRMALPGSAGPSDRTRPFPGQAVMAAGPTLPGGTGAADPAVLVDPSDFRSLWRGLAGSVFVVATGDGDRRAVMAATAVCSVSMEPPSLLVCINRTASAIRLIDRRGAFSVGLLPASAHDIGRHVGSETGMRRFDKGDWGTATLPDTVVDGLPWLRQAQATLFCGIDARHDYGTHTIFIGKVTALAGHGGDDPLLYCDGAYCGRGESIG